MLGTERIIVWDARAVEQNQTGYSDRQRQKEEVSIVGL